MSVLDAHDDEATLCCGHRGPLIVTNLIVWPAGKHKRKLGNTGEQNRMYNAGPWSRGCVWRPQARGHFFRGRNMSGRQHRGVCQQSHPSVIPGSFTLDEPFSKGQRRGSVCTKTCFGSRWYFHTRCMFAYMDIAHVLLITYLRTCVRMRLLSIPSQAAKMIG